MRLVKLQFRQSRGFCCRKQEAHEIRDKRCATTIQLLWVKKISNTALNETML